MMKENDFSEDIFMNKCVIIINESLPPGRAANAAAVIALTMGQRHPKLVGPPLVDASNIYHPGLIPIGISILSGTAENMRSIREKALGIENIDLIDFPEQGQQTKDYSSFLKAVEKISVNELVYAGMALVGEKKKISKLVSSLKLFD